jgi:outer membrane protein OmpA-like peptidoglycan-associated protein
MKKYQGILVVAIALIAVFGFESCSPASGNSTGSEYMPDMGHSIAYEANTYNYYYQNTWNTESEKSDQSGFSKLDLTLHNLPVNNTVPRGYAGVVNTKTGSEYVAKIKELRGETTTNAVAVPVNGQVPYYIENTEEGRTYAYTAEELRQNPYPISAKGLEEGKELYEVFCGICHGNKGDGNGWLVDETNPNVKYPAQPTSYLTDELINAENGRYYHVLMQGKGVMGAYADKISYEERWQVIHYIRSIQAKEKSLAYSPYENTLNTWATPITDSDWPVDLSRSELAKDVRKAISSKKATKKEFTLENVFFNTGLADLKVESKMELNELAEILREYSTAVIEVGGHTDDTGTAEGNVQLSDDRANVVRAYLEGKGIATERLQAKGYGQLSPIAKNNTETGRAKNRRTAFTVLSK